MQGPAVQVRYRLSKRRRGSPWRKLGGTAGVFW